MIGHKTICPHFGAGFLYLLGKKIAIDFVVPVFKENGFAPVTSLGDMMRTGGHNDSGESGHGEILP